MRCPHCSSTATTERLERPLLNRLPVPTDVGFLIVLWRLRFKLSLRDLAEVLLLHELAFSHEAVRDWEAKLAQLLTEALRKRRKGKIGWSWYVDETYLKVAGQWQYLHRAIDSDGNLVDVFLGATRNQAVAEAFFRPAVAVTGIIPETITTDKQADYPPALEEVFGKDVEHHTSKYKTDEITTIRSKIIAGSKAVRARCAVSCGRRPSASSTSQRARQRAIHVKRVAALRDMLGVA